MRWTWLLVSYLLVSLPQTGRAAFTDVTKSVGIDYMQWNPRPGSLETFRVTGGAAAGDVNGDGFPDLFVTRVDATDLLFLNDGKGSFVDSSQEAGFTELSPSNGAALADIDNDGDSDLYVTSMGDTRHYLFVNDGAGHFSEQGRERHAAIETNSKHLGMSATFGDYDRDGYLDIHTTEWGNTNYIPLQLTSHARVLRNQGARQPGTFTDVTQQTKLVLDDYVGFTPTETRDGSWNFTSTFADFDRDGWQDLAIVGDFHTSRLYWNQGNGTFRMAPGPDMLNPSGIGTDENGMGSAVADINGDGLLDWFVTSVFDPRDPCKTQACHWNGSGNRLYLNNGDRTFTDVTDQAGVRDGQWGWGAAFLDYDNDGDLDLAMTNGMVADSPLADPYIDDPMKLFRNDGNGTFVDVAAEEGLTDTGSGKGLLTLDYDLDGDLDLFVVNNGDAPKLYRNDLEGSQSFLKIETEGTVSNRNGIGSFLTLITDPGAKPQTRFISGGGVNYLSQSDLTVHFGLGERIEPIYELSIDWPSGIRQVFHQVDVNSTLRAIEPVPEPHASCLLIAMSLTLRRFRCRATDASDPELG